jgi:hypothetical protein
MLPKKRHRETRCLSGLRGAWFVQVIRIDLFIKIAKVGTAVALEVDAAVSGTKPKAL